MSMLSHKSPPPPCAIVIFGANGDLTKRLIIPALYNLARTGCCPQSLALVGVDHNKKTSEEWTGQLKDFLAQLLAKNNEEIDETLWQQVARCMTFLSGDFEKPDTYQRLKDLLAELDENSRWAAMCCSTWRWPTVSSAPSPASWARPGWWMPAPRAFPPPDRGKALRPRPGLGQGAQCLPAEMAEGRTDLPHRPFPGQGDGAEHHGAALRQRAVRADLEPRPHRPCPDHGGRIHRRGDARQIL